MIRRVMVAGGGTGGHLFPGIAVVEELRRRSPEIEALFVGTRGGIESRLLPDLGYELLPIEVLPLKGRSPGELLRSLSALPASAAQALSLVKSRRPDLVIGLGGFAAGPVLLAASLCRTPTALLEQNAHVGLTNRLLSRTVGRAYLTYEQTAAQFGRERARVLGNPVRREFVQAARIAASDPEGIEARSRDLMVIGGSQGARALNEAIPPALEKAGLTGRGMTVVHQTGEAMVEQVSALYRQAGIEARVSPFIHDMARAYASARLVIARAGATTLAELCAIGRPSILVPYPYAADDHQAKNASALQQAGAAVMIAQDTLTPELLAREVASLLDDDGRRRAMAAAARRQGRPDAAAAIVDDLGAWLGLPSPETPAPDGGPSPDPGPSAPRGAFSRQARSSRQARPSAARLRPKLKQKKLPVHTV